jgi:hypothetical protein
MHLSSPFCVHSQERKVTLPTVKNNSVCSTVGKILMHEKQPMADVYVTGSSIPYDRAIVQGNQIGEV